MWPAPVAFTDFINLIVSSIQKLAVLVEPVDEEILSVKPILSIPAKKLIGLHLESRTCMLDSYPLKGPIFTPQSHQGSTVLVLLHGAVQFLTILSK